MEGYSLKKPEKKVKGVRGNIIEGGPVKPDTTNMTEEESLQALREYAKERKACTDKQRSKRRKKGNLLASVDWSRSWKNEDWLWVILSLIKSFCACVSWNQNFAPNDR